MVQSAQHIQQRNIQLKLVTKCVVLLAKCHTLQSHVLKITSPSLVRRNYHVSLPQNVNIIYEAYNTYDFGHVKLSVCYR